jgi:hypothetical protein
MESFYTETSKFTGHPTPSSMSEPADAMWAGCLVWYQKKFEELENGRFTAIRKKKIVDDGVGDWLWSTGGEPLWFRSLTTFEKKRRFGIELPGSSGWCSWVLFSPKKLIRIYRSMKRMNWKWRRNQSDLHLLRHTKLVKWHRLHISEVGEKEFTLKSSDTDD